MNVFGCDLYSFLDTFAVSKAFLIVSGDKLYLLGENILYCSVLSI
jgi:hypothetical protein